MTVPRNPDTRERLLAAAADLIAASPGQDVPLRAICDQAGVKLPTLYHFFGSKEGMLDAVIEHGFDLYLGVKQGHESSGDPIQDIRDGWDAHVRFGLDNPGFYALMYGQVTPGRQPHAQRRPTEILLGITRAAARQGRLVVSAEQAGHHVLAANIGVTLRLIVSGASDDDLSAAMREATIAAITGIGAPTDADLPAFVIAARQLSAVLPPAGARLSRSETALLRDWLLLLGTDSRDREPNPRPG